MIFKHAPDASAFVSHAHKDASSQSIIPDSDIILTSVLIFPILAMATERQPVKDILEEAEKLSSTDPRKAATLYQEILSKQCSARVVASFKYSSLVAYCTDGQVRRKEGDDILKYQETALVKLGELYRDLKYVRSNACSLDALTVSFREPIAMQKAFLKL